MRLPLTYSSFIALMTGTILTGTLFHADQNVWSLAFSKTLVMTVEIGVILIGAFFFLEVARKGGVIDSLARLVRAVSPNRIIQGLLVSFPLTLMVEGSSGFGTPFLVIAPILLALHFDLRLCALLPFITCVVGIPYGALGTPTRLGFPDANPTVGTFMLLSPLMVIAPLLSIYLISKRLPVKESLWAVSMSLIYYFIGRGAAFNGPELAALGPAFFVFAYGLVSARILFGEKNHEPIEYKGIVIYGLLLLSMWLGKEQWMDQKFEGSQIRIFNPGFVFILFALFLMPFTRGHSPKAILNDTFQRARKTLTVFFCMTFLVQQLRANGSLDALTVSIPAFLKDDATPVLGWIGSAFVGTSTMANLLISKVVDPVKYASLAAGSAIGVQMAFQSVVAIRTLLHEKLTEKEIYLQMAPISIGFLLIISLFAHFSGIH